VNVRRIPGEISTVIGRHAKPQDPGCGWRRPAEAPSTYGLVTIRAGMVVLPG